MRFQMYACGTAVPRGCLSGGVCYCQIVLCVHQNIVITVSALSWHLFSKMADKTKILSLYKSLMKESKRIPSYNFR